MELKDVETRTVIILFEGLKELHKQSDKYLVCTLGIHKKEVLALKRQFENELKQRTEEVA